MSRIDRSGIYAVCAAVAATASVPLLVFPAAEIVLALGALVLSLLAIRSGSRRTLVVAGASLLLALESIGLGTFMLLFVEV